MLSDNEEIDNEGDHENIEIRKVQRKSIFGFQVKLKKVGGPEGNDNDSEIHLPKPRHGSDSDEPDSPNAKKFK